MLYNFSNLRHQITHLKMVQLIRPLMHCSVCFFLDYWIEVLMLILYFSYQNCMSVEISN